MSELEMQVAHADDILTIYRGLFDEWHVRVKEDPRDEVLRDLAVYILEYEDLTPEEASAWARGAYEGIEHALKETQLIRRLNDVYRRLGVTKSIDFPIRR